MSPIYLLVAFGYVVLGCLVWAFEYRRIRRTGVDMITMFLALCFLQTGIAAIAIYGSLPFVNPAAPTGYVLFDRIFRSSDITTALFVLALTAWFIVFFYVGTALTRLVLAARPGTASRLRFRLVASHGRLMGLLLLGFLLVVYSFWGLGDSLTSRFANLILLRADNAAVTRTALNSNAIALTQTFGWLAVLALFVTLEHRKWRWTWPICLGLVAVFAVLGVSRRALFLPVILAYLVVVLKSGRWRALWIAAGAIPMFLVLAFGKEVISWVAFGSPGSMVLGYESAASAVLRASSELGITVVESLGTLTFIPDQWRFGVDHVTSLAQRFPDGMLGLDINFPERMVRVSTEAFLGHDAQDVPPGFLGQMWLDFAVFGPMVWGVLFGLQVGVLQFVFERTERSRVAAAVFVLLLFVIALPVNSGSFDFTFSVDIFAVLGAIWWCVRLRRLPVSPPAAVPPAAAPA